MASTGQSLKKNKATGVSRAKNQRLPKDLLTVADIPRKKIQDLVKAQGEKLKSYEHTLKSSIEKLNKKHSVKK